MPSLTSSAAHDPNGGTTAPVLEFVCLFTHDLKRKQKRWQDGRLKYHTFNKRVMVYDERGNFVGDMHWHRDWDFDEGEEVELERGGVIVQVAECVGRKDQDLSELLDKRAKEKEQRAASRPLMLRPPNAAAPMQRTPAPQDHFQTRHRPLHQLIGTPTGHHGRALVPTESPFEQKQRADSNLQNPDAGRSGKRRKYDTTPPSKMGYAQSLFGAPLTLSAVPLSSAPPRRPPATKPSSSPSAAVVDLVTQSPATQSSATAPPTSLLKPTGRNRPPLETASSARESRKAVAVSSVNVKDRPTDARVVSSYFDDTDIDDPIDQSHTPHLDVDTEVVSGDDRSVALSAEQHKDDEDSKASRRKRPGGLAGHTNEVDRPNDVVSMKTLARPIVTEKLARAKVQKKSAAERRDQSLTRSLSPLREATPNRILRPPDDVNVENNIPRKGARAELRLKSRQKRGLLMASEAPKKPKRSKTEKMSGAAVEKDVAISELPRPDPVRIPLDGLSTSAQPSGAPACSPTGKRISAANASVSGSLSRAREFDTESVSFCSKETVNIDSFDDTPRASADFQERDVDEDSGAGNPFGYIPDMVADSVPPTQEPDQNNTYLTTKRTKPRRKSLKNDRNRSGSDTDTDPPEQLARKRVVISETAMREAEPVDDAPTVTAMKRRRAIVSDPEDSDQHLPRVPVGPRLAKLSRRGVRSKEVIGFILSSSPIPEPSPPSRRAALAPFSFVSSPEPSSAEVAKEGEGVEYVLTELTTGGKCSPLPLPDAHRDPDVTSLRLDDLDGQKLQQTNSHEEPPIRMESDSAGEITMLSGTEKEAIRGGVARRGMVRALDGDMDGSLSASETLADLRNCSNSDNKPANAGPRSVTDGNAEENDVQPTLHKDVDSHVRPMVTGHPGEAREADNRAPDMACAANAPQKSRPRITNPASRGRKAALKSDAAGQVPKSILPPPEPVSARLRVQVAPEIRKDSNGNERPKRTMRFPGFSSARGGGPWSREAHDLLESGRPV
ncbi:hypothetical protein QBC47DRAFT_136815 [Echria macrotheca]|uniref:5'-3' DNA helicase ZGRF1-like N-terminal domain-containing protein n=1 Tax=Echria macrotheca TaxID=438768 RepID=A0AAJ0F7T6_9PEZI|nr:hypothetical protein QBC47DRAFT_136815 [Echria macrotheca]